MYVHIKKNYEIMNVLLRIIILFSIFSFIRFLSFNTSKHTNIFNTFSHHSIRNM